MMRISKGGQAGKKKKVTQTALRGRETYLQRLKDVYLSRGYVHCAEEGSLKKPVVVGEKEAAQRRCAEGRDILGEKYITPR